MVFHRLGAFALATAVATSALEASSYFSGTSPFYLFSSSTLETSSLEGKQIALGEDVRSTVSDILSSCPSDTYVVVNQPGVHALDFQREGVVPNLQRWFTKGHARTMSSAAVGQVQGQVDADKVSTMLAEECHAKQRKIDTTGGAMTVDNSRPRVLTLDFSPLSWDEERDSTLANHDEFLNNILHGLNGESYTVIYTTSPSQDSEPSEMGHAHGSYEMENTYEDAMHIELKRDLSSREGNSNLNSTLPLFEKYQFLSPGIFMGGIFFLMFFLILYVALSALSSVQVSYFAFSKEMGPSAQKKQQ